MMEKHFHITTCFILICLISNTEASQLSKFQKWESPSYFRGFDVGLWCSDTDCEKTQEDFIDLKNTGANFAQINVYGVGFRFPTSPYNINPEGIDWITTMVEYCRSVDLYYVIAVRVGPGRLDVSDDIESTLWNKGNEIQAQLYGKMLKEIAAEYLPDTLFVGLNLTVEPNPLADQYLSPEDLSTALSNNGIDLYSVNKMWIDSVRTVAPNLPLIVQAAQFSSPEYWVEPVLIKKQNDPYIVYDFHTYEPFDDFTHFPVTNGASYPTTAWNETLQDDVLWDSTFYANVVFDRVLTFQQTHNVPILMGEFGMLYPQNNGEKYLSDIFDIAIDNKWHFALWSWRADGTNGKIYFDYERFDEVSSGTNYWNLVKSFFSEKITSNNDSFNAYKFQLFQNYPNPFNPATTISYSVPTWSKVILKVYDVLGREILTLAEKEQSKGHYKTEFNAENISSGIYMYRLNIIPNDKSIGEFVEAKKMLILK